MVATVEQSAISVSDLMVGFGKKIVLDRLSLEVRRGEILGLVGASGGGKSVLLRTIIGLIPKRQGHIEIMGMELDKADPREIRTIGRRWGILFQQGALFSSLTVRQNVQFPMRENLEISDSLLEELATAKLEMVGLSRDDGDKFPSELSGGMTKRAALARALALDPEIVFLDEPTSGLDPVASREVHELIDGLRERGVTVFLTTHRLEEAERLCDRVAILNTGLRTIGRPDELRDRLFTKSLVVRTVAPLASPDAVFAVAGVDGWHADDTSSYVLTVTDARIAAPAVTRALVAAGADVLSLAEAQHSLEDIYLELVDDDVEAAT
jgi:phospholipid/cholesterol/gamma-HCH transport system ATP-binding protein